jgi:hypothetical protein
MMQSTVTVIVYADHKPRLYDGSGYALKPIDCSTNSVAQRKSITKHAVIKVTYES